MVKAFIPLLVRKIFDKRTEKIAFAFLDQGIFSVTNFAVNILLARWLSGEDYGAFAVSFSIYIIASSFQGALVLEPISVFGSNIEKNDLPSYINKSFHIHIKINLIITLVMLMVSLFLRSPIKEAFIGAAIAIPFTFVIWLYRRFCYINMQTKLSALISFTYLLFTFIGIFTLSMLNLLSPFSCFIVLALSSFITAIFFMKTFQARIRWSEILNLDFISDPVVRNNWNYGKWILAATISDSIQSLFYIPLIALILGLNQAAGFRAMQNFILPVQQIHAAISIMIIPWLSKRVVEGINVLNNRSIFKLSGYYLLPAVLYMIPTLLFCKDISSIIYGSEYYNDFIWMIPLLLLYTILISFTLSFAVTLRAVMFSPPLLWSKMSAAFLTIVLGSVFIYFLGLQGVILSLFVAILAEGLIMIIAVHQARNVA